MMSFVWLYLACSMQGLLVVSGLSVNTRVCFSRRSSKLAEPLVLSSSTAASSYSANEITVLSGLEPVRLRPGMYIGSTGPDGLHHLLWEVLDNSVDEALGGHASRIAVTLLPEGKVRVVDNGRGIPTDVHEATGVSALETVLTVLHAGGKFANAQQQQQLNGAATTNTNNSNSSPQQANGYKVSGGLHGVGISVVNALSQSTRVIVKRNHALHHMDFQRGIPTSALQVHPLDTSNNLPHEGLDLWQHEEPSGTAVVFQPDALIFQTNDAANDNDIDIDNEETPSLHNHKNPSSSSSSKLEFQIERIMKRMDEIAYLNPGLTLTLQDARSTTLQPPPPPDSSTTKTKTHWTFCHEGGLAEYVNLLCRTKEPLSPLNIKPAKSTKKKKKKTKKTKSDTDPDNDQEEDQDDTPPPPPPILQTGPLANLLDAQGTILITSIHHPPTSITVNLALRWSADAYQESMTSFVNNIRTKDGGTHVEGCKVAITRAVNAAMKRFGKQLEDSSSSSSKKGKTMRAKKTKTKKTAATSTTSTTSTSTTSTMENLKGEYIREGLTAILSIHVPNPEFEGQTKGRLGNPEARPAVDFVVSNVLEKVFDWQPELLTGIVQKARRAMEAARAAKAARDATRKKSLLGRAVLPGKLADCVHSRTSNQDEEDDETEIFIVEGDSAAGSAKQGRNRFTQAVLPLRGKILNIERASSEKIYGNAELQNLIQALGLGLRGVQEEEEEEEDVEVEVVEENKNNKNNKKQKNGKKSASSSSALENSLRYGKIIIMTDADVDGAHIRVLLLTFFYRYKRELIEKGHVYIAQPPLYRVSRKQGKKNVDEYAHSDEERDEILRAWGVLQQEQHQQQQEEDMDMEEEDMDEDEIVEEQVSANTPAFTSNKKVSIQRFKGLGEMMPTQLWETTMDPSRRKLKLVTVEDCEAADVMLNVLMGDAVGPRKAFIKNHAGEFSGLGDVDV